jgi:hypothetical protein
VRTTINLPQDLHRVAVAIARDRHQTLSQTIAQLIRQALNMPETGPVVSEHRDGFPLLRTGRALTAEDVRGLDDET